MLPRSLNENGRVLPDTGFENLVQKYGQFVLNTAYRILGDRARAEDVHQDVFMAVWRRWDSYNGDTKWLGYLKKCAVRQSLLYAKVSKKNISLDGCNEPETNSNSNAENRAITIEMKDRLRELIGKLPEKQAEVFVMSRIEGKEYVEIANFLGCSVETARVHMHRALKKLAEEFRDYVKS